jgi:hypothetical protein
MVGLPHGTQLTAPTITVRLCDRAVVARFVIVLACPKVVRLYRTYLRNRTVV